MQVLILFIGDLAPLSFKWEMIMSKDLENARKIAYNTIWIKPEKTLNKTKVIKDAIDYVEKEHQNKLKTFGEYYRFEAAQNDLTFYKYNALSKVLGSISSDEKTVESCEKRLEKNYKLRDLLQLEYETIVSRGVTLKEEMVNKKS